jgi:DhnA family fructose-bisphosphate aldolase class Ia
MTTPFGKQVIVAIDHGLNWGIYEGFENPQATLETVLKNDPDGILASVPFIRRFQDTIEEYSNIRTIATIDLLHDSTLPGDRGDAEIHSQVFDVETVANLGVDAMKVALVYGRDDPAILEKNINFVANAAQRGRELGIPLIVEPTLWGNRIEDDLDPEYLANANRLAFELGADILKSPYPGNRESFAPIADNAPQPLYIAGGPAAESDTEVLEMVRGAMDEGALGIMFGRNIWQHEDPGRIIDALSTIVHEDASVETATELL